MGVKTKTVTTWTCDLCGVECRKDSNEINYAINAGCRDGGPTKIQARVSVYIPYGTANGHLCRTCTLKYLSEYVASEEGVFLVRRSAE